jgi:hypothetical protein
MVLQLKVNRETWETIPPIVGDIVCFRIGYDFYEGVVAHGPFKQSDINCVVVRTSHDGNFVIPYDDLLAYYEDNKQKYED